MCVPCLSCHGHASKARARASTAPWLGFGPGLRIQDSGNDGLRLQNSRFRGLLLDFGSGLLL